MLLAAIVTAEVLFWAFLIGGLLSRYVLGWKTLGLIMLALTPIVDLVLIGITYLDLHDGGKSNFTHGLSAFYIGYSITLGPKVVKEMDRRFASRFGEGKPVESNFRSYREQVNIWKRVIVASIITLTLLGAGFLIVGFSGSFWLIYWAITAVFIVLGWWFLGPYQAKRKEARSAASNVPIV